MIRVLGGPKRLCDGITRRDLIQVGSLGLGAGLRPTIAAEHSASKLPGFGKARSSILLDLYGPLPLKPEAEVITEALA